jgi:predicted nucleotidyltransferase
MNVDLVKKKQKVAESLKISLELIQTEIEELKSRKEPV